jgi:L-fuconolactonase
VAHLLECFGAERVMWGSDWPVVELAGGFERWREASLGLLEALGDAESAAILGGNAARFYGLDAK